MGTPENRITGNGHRWPGIAYPAGTSSQEIEADIVRTREQMDRTLHEIDEALHPRHLLDDLLKFIRRQDILGDDLKAAGGRIGQQFKRHPMPTALVGAGLAWLLFEYKYGSPIARWKKSQADRGQSREEQGVSSFMNDVEDVTTFESQTAVCEIPVVGEAHETAPGGRAKGAIRAASEKAAEVRQSMRQARHRARRGIHAARGRLGSVGHKAGSIASKIGDSFSNAATRSRHMAAHLGDSATASMRQAKDRVTQTADEHPVATAFGLLSLGMLAGLMLPRTRREDEFVGGISDDLKIRTKEQVRRAAGQVKEVATSVASSVKDAAIESANQAGLSPSQLREKVKDVASSVTEAARHELEARGLPPEQLKEKAAGVTDNGESEYNERESVVEASSVVEGMEQLKEKFGELKKCDCEHERRGGLDL